MIKSLSFWEREFITKNVDFAIIGAGIVGLSTAYFLKRKYPSKKVIVLERQYPGLGAIGSPTEILADIKANGEQHAIDLIKMRWNGLSLLKEVIDPLKMDLRNLGSRELFETAEKEELVLSKLDYLNQILQAATEVPKVFSVTDNAEILGLRSKAVLCRSESQLDPMLMMNELAYKARTEGVQIIFGAAVTELDAGNGTILISGDYELAAQQIIVCNNGFAEDLLSIKDLKAVRNQVLITKPLRSIPIKGNYHFDEGYVYFRSYGKRILLGGARNIDSEKETTSSFGENQRIISHLKTFMSNHIYKADDLEYDMQWSGILGVGKSKQPIIERITDRTTVAVRLGGMGVAIGSYVGNKTAELITAS